jgi:hypothetical protein
MSIQRNAYRDLMVKGVVAMRKSVGVYDPTLKPAKFEGFPRIRAKMTKPQALRHVLHLLQTVEECLKHKLKDDELVHCWGTLVFANGILFSYGYHNLFDG